MGKKYDLQINADNQLISDLAKPEEKGGGWKVFQNKEELAKRNADAQRYIYVGILGHYNVGKTHLLEQLSGRSLGSGTSKTSETKGVSGVYPAKKDDKIVYFDSAGSKRP